MRDIPVVLSAVAALAVLAACGTGGGTPPSSPSGSPSSVIVTPDPAVTTTAAPVAAPPCTRDSLNAAYTYVEGTAGQVHGYLTYENRTDAACSLTGYPTVYLGEPEAAGGMGGASTDDPNDPGVPLDLQPGAEAYAKLTITQAGNLGCEVVDTDYLAVAPPGQTFDIEVTAQHVAADGLQGCRDASISLVMTGGFTANAG